MDEDRVLGFLQKQLRVAEKKAEDNTVFPRGEKFPHRPPFKKLKKQVTDFLKGKNKRDIVVMPGLRGVGKTTLLYQLYQEARKKLRRENILYLSCDRVQHRLDASLAEVLEIYEKKVLEQNLETLEDKTLILVDEAHYQKNWDTILKTLSDRSKNVLFIVTGSSALSIDLSTDLIRRSYRENVFPLNFREYLNLTSENPIFTSKVEGLEKACFQKTEPSKREELLDGQIRKLRNEQITSIDRDIENEITDFLLKGGFPFSLEEEQHTVHEDVLDTLDKIVSSDMAKGIGLSQKAENKAIPILELIADSRDAVSLQKISKSLEISVSTVEKILKGFKRAGALNIVKPGGGSRQIRSKAQKYFTTTPTIQASLLGSLGILNRRSDTLGLLLETAVSNVLFRKSLKRPKKIRDIFYDYRDGGADFIVELQQDRKCIIEVGWGDKGQKGVKQIKNTLEQTDADYGIVVSSTDREYRKVNYSYNEEEKTSPVYFVPKQIFLLL